MILVVDTSVVVKWFVDEPDRALARQVLLTEAQRAAPDFVIAEVPNVLWRRQRGGDVQPAQVDEAVKKMPDFFQQLAPSASLVEGALRFARELKHSVYDCMFLALAAQLPDAKLVTADMRFLEKIDMTDYRSLVVPLSEFSPLPEA